MAIRNSAAAHGFDLYARPEGPLASLAASAAATNATLVVTTLEDENDAGATVASPGGTGLSLREALSIAGAASGADHITFAEGLAGGTLTLGRGQLLLNHDVTIDGELDGDAAPDITIATQGAYRLFYVGAYGGSAAATAVTLNGLILSGGQAVGASGAAGAGGGGGGGGGLGAGGALFVRAGAELVLDGVELSYNGARGGAGGAGGSGELGFGGSGGSSPIGGSGGGLGGASTQSGQAGGFGAGGGGGGGWDDGVFTDTDGGNGGAGGFGAGGGGGGNEGGFGAAGGYGGGNGAGGGTFGGAGGSGASLGGAMFVQAGASVTVTGAGLVTGNGLQGMPGAIGAGRGLFLQGQTITFAPRAGEVITVTDAIDDGGAAHPGALIKTGAGTLVLTWTNNYRGGTTVEAGVLQVTGAIGSATVAAGATLAGTGTTGALGLQAGSLFAVEVGAAGGPLDVLGTVSVEAGLQASLATGVVPNNGQAFVILANDGADAVLGGFQGLGEGATLVVGEIVFEISYAGGDGNDVDLTARVVRGTEAGDSLAGTAGAETVDGLGGDDVLSGGGGADVMFGRDGADTLLGEAGADLAYGGEGADVMDGGSDGDFLSGGGGADRVYGGAGWDTLHGDDGADLLSGGGDGDVAYGGGGDDELHGDDGADILVGDAGFDFLSGGSGADTLYGGTENDAMDGGGGADLVSGGAGDDIGYGGDALDTLYGDDGADFLSGGAGDDLVSGGADDDQVHGDLGGDRLYGDNGADTLTGGGDGDQLTGGVGADRFVFTSLGDSTVTAGDWLTDFSAAAGDVIDISAIDANVHVAGNQDFVFRDFFTAEAGQAVLYYDAGMNITRLWLDVDGDGGTEFDLWMTGEVGRTTGWAGAASATAAPDPGDAGAQLAHWDGGGGGHYLL